MYQLSDVRLPLGLRQRDEFTFRKSGGVTTVSIEIELAAKGVVARLVRPLYWHLYARRMYSRTFRAAGTLCERDAPNVITG